LLQRRRKVLDAIEKAESAGDHKKADRLTGLLNAGQTVKAPEEINGKPAAPKKASVVDVPRTLHDHANKAYSEFYEGCAKAMMPGEIDVLAASLGRMSEALEAARSRITPA
jgi:hypothetical protein